MKVLSGSNKCKLAASDFHSVSVEWDCIAPYIFKPYSSMAKRKSSGILLFRRKAPEPEVFLVLHGGPYWIGKDAGAWTIPKGEFEEPEHPMDTAIREFEEETGTRLNGAFIQLTPVFQKAGKQVFAWALEGDLDANAIRSNTFTMEWPPRSGKWQTFPEVAKGAWFSLTEAKEKINAAQVPFLDELLLKTGQAND
jgi:predicted NUDIX family NTP pyrophosphohydrolase